MTKPPISLLEARAICDTLPKDSKEDAEQIALVAWVRAKGWRCAHMANEGKVPVQYRVKLSKKGLSPGFPDLMVFVPKKDETTELVYIELKRQGSTACAVKPNQTEWLNFLFEMGSRSTVAKGAKDAIEWLETIEKS